MMTTLRALTEKVDRHVITDGYCKQRDENSNNQKEMLEIIYKKQTNKQKTNRSEACFLGLTS